VTATSRRSQPLDAGQIKELARRALEREPAIAVAWLFGSAARGRMGALSDIDIAYLCYPGHPIDRVHVGAVLMEALGTDRVDAVPLENAPPTLCHAVLRDGIVVLSRDEDLRILFQEEVVRRFMDARPLVEDQIDGLRSWIRAL
jgi:predicted nucleotidyltransferase